MRVGVLTGGGDCPGLNAAIRAIVRKGIDVHGHEIVGFRDGWRGPLENLHEELTVESTRGHPAARRDDPRHLPDEPVQARGRARARPRDDGRRFDLDGLIAIGGEDTLGAAARLHGEHGVPVIGVPKTIDNDLAATDVTFGFDTALQVATEAIDRLHTTAESHHRVMVVEVMGRHAGWIALHSGLAGGADVILIPERPFDIEEVCGLISRRHARGRNFSIVVVAEGALPGEGTMEVDRRREGRVRPRPARAGSASASSARSSSEPASRRARWSSATSSGAARRRRSTACSPPGSAWPRSTPPTTGAGGRCRRCAARGSSSSPLARRSRAAHRSARGLRGRVAVLRLVP